MVLSKRFETKGSKPAAKVPPKRRHFAAITEIPETRPPQLAQLLFLKEPEILKRRGDRRLLRPVWVATQGFDLEF